MTTILQWIYDIFTILTNFIVLISPNAIADILLKICNLFSIVFIMTIAYLLYDWATNKTKKPIIQISCFGVFITIMVSAFLSFLLLFEVPFLPKITPSFTHEHYSNIVIKPNKKQLYTNKSNINWSFNYINNPFVYELSTNKFNNHDVRDVMNDDNLIYGDLIGYKGNSETKVNARLLKENIHITKTKNAKKYPDYASYKITKIETRNGSLTETAYHKSIKFEFKELYLEVIADVEPDKMKDAKQDEQDRKNQKDINQLLNK